MGTGSICIPSSILVANISAKCRSCITCCIFEEYHKNDKMFYSNESTRTLLIPREVTSSDFLAELLSPSPASLRPPLLPSGCSGYYEKGKWQRFKGKKGRHIIRGFPVQSVPKRDNLGHQKLLEKVAGHHNFPQAVGDPSNLVSPIRNGAPCLAEGVQLAKAAAARSIAVSFGSESYLSRRSLSVLSATVRSDVVVDSGGGGDGGGVKWN